MDLTKMIPVLDSTYSASFMIITVLVLKKGRLKNIPLKKFS